MKQLSSVSREQKEMFVFHSLLFSSVLLASGGGMALPTVRVYFPQGTCSQNVLSDTPRWYLSLLVTSLVL